MMATAFLGYGYSPKWFNISVLYFYFILILLLYGFISKEENVNKGNMKNNLKYKVNSKILFNKSIIKRGYSTSCSLNSMKISERLKTIIQELGLNPIYIYENLNSEDTRKQILKDTRDLSGIYMIVNKTTKDYYIGSASTNKFYARFSKHVIYFKGSKIVKLAVQKYGIDNFAFMVLELYPNVVTKENNKELMNLEDKYLKLFLPNYNILTEAGSSFGYKHTEVDRQKMKDIYSDVRREIIGSLNRGKKLSPETIEKLRERALNRSPMSDETKKKCITKTRPSPPPVGRVHAPTKEGGARPVVLYNLNGTVYGEYSTIFDAANAINCNEKTIRRALKTEKKLVKRQ